jgi:cytochrome c-type biogenesis protein CcmE
MGDAGKTNMRTAQVIRGHLRIRCIRSVIEVFLVRDAPEHSSQRDERSGGKQSRRSGVVRRGEVNRASGGVPVTFRWRSGGDPVAIRWRGTP